MRFMELIKAKKKLVAATAAAMLGLAGAGSYVTLTDMLDEEAEYAFLGKFNEVRVIDGDTLHGPKIAGQPQLKVRLHGVDTPEKGQKCLDENDSEYKCGVMATSYLKELIGNNPVACQVHEKDRYGRSVGTCYVFRDGDRDKWSLNRRMVMRGWAYSYTKYSDDFASDQADAERNKLGLFREGHFTVAPWEYRRPAFMRVAPTKTCNVKGDVSATGDKVYYEKTTPGYSAVDIDVKSGTGEIWFCNVKAAERAGWVRAGN